MLELFNENNISVYTCFNSTSVHGLPIKVLKSGICKYFRRNIEDKFQWCVMEIALFNEHSKGTPLISNLINRLKILLMEDISFEEVDRIYNSIHLINEYEMNRGDYDLLLQYCNVLKGGIKNRLTSYVNSWWKNNHNQIRIDTIELDKSKKYFKKGDSNELCILCEYLIKFIELNSEEIFGIFIKLCNIKEKCGRRYKRNEAVYLWFEVIEDHLINANKKVKLIFNFALEMFHRKQMKERYAFGIWIGLYVHKYNVLDISDKSYRIDVSYTNYYTSHCKIKIDDFVVNDIHVNRSYGMEYFAKNGAFVKDENCSIMDNGAKYKEFYLKDKIECDRKGGNGSISNINDSNIINTHKYIHWNSFTNIQVLEEGVCSGKVCCVKVTFQNKEYILKQMGKSMNYGRDYLLIDGCKRLFGLTDLNMELIQSNKMLCRMDKTNRSFIKNWTFIEKDTVYCKMNYMDNIGDLGKNKNRLMNDTVQYECMKIRLFDGLFRSSDNILRNILITSDNTLISIDEGDIFGKRKSIFNKHDWCKDNISINIVKSVLSDLLYNKDYKKKQVVNNMKKLGFSDLTNEFINRFNNYNNIVLKELSIQ